MSNKPAVNSNNCGEEAELRAPFPLLTKMSHCVESAGNSGRKNFCSRSSPSLTRRNSSLYEETPVRTRKFYASRARCDSKACCLTSRALIAFVRRESNALNVPSGARVRGWGTGKTSSDDVSNANVSSSYKEAARRLLTGDVFLLMGLRF